VLCDPTDQTADYVQDASKKHCVTEALQPSLAGAVVLCTYESNLLATLARKYGIEHQAVHALRGEGIRGAYALSERKRATQGLPGRAQRAACDPATSQVTRAGPAPWIATLSPMPNPSRCRVTYRRLSASFTNQNRARRKCRQRILSGVGFVSRAESRNKVAGCTAPCNADAERACRLDVDGNIQPIIDAD